MSRRTAGIVLVSVAALVNAARYLAAAIFGSSLTSWSGELFQAMLQYVSKNLLVWSLALLVAGVVYLVWAEIGTVQANRMSQN